MKTRSLAVLISLFSLLTILVAACGGSETKEVVVTKASSEREVVVETVVEKETVRPTHMPTTEPVTDAGESVGQERLASGPVADFQPQTTQRLIIKDATLDLEVENTDRAIGGVTQVVGDKQGYIISQRVWYDGGHKYATLTIGVPVQEFENALRRLRGLATRVLNESASGEDVTDQYVDLQSRLRNLEATRDRIRVFLDQATTIDEALEVNRQLSEMEDQIEQVKGRLNYLRDRAAFSTITVNLNPLLPTPTLAPPTPTPTPTAVPATPTPDVWRPGETVGEATGVLTAILKGLTEFSIWVIIVLGPFAVAGALGLWLLARLGKWIKRRTTSALQEQRSDQTRE